MTSQFAIPLLETMRLCGQPAAKMEKPLAEQNAASTRGIQDPSSHPSQWKWVVELGRRPELFFSAKFVSSLGTFSPESYSELIKWLVVRFRQK